MGLYVKQQNTRSQLQERLAQELQDRAKEKEFETERPDGVDDSRYIEGTKKTTTLAWVWGFIFAAIVGIIIWLLIATA